MTDRELLELAAKAAGYVIDEFERNGSAWVHLKGSSPNEDGEHPSFKWNPLNDDGDAMRLAVELGMNVYCSNPLNMAAEIIPDAEDSQIIVKVKPKNKDDLFAANRYVIVHAAAELGKNMDD